MRYIAILEAPPPGSRKNWSAFFPDLPGCIATGKDFEEIASEIREALSLHLEGIAEDGETPPVARTLRDILKDPEFAKMFEERLAHPLPVTAREGVGKRTRVNITIGEGLLARVDKRAAATGSSRSGLIEDALLAVLET